MKERSERERERVFFQKRAQVLNSFMLLAAILPGISVLNGLTNKNS